MFICIIHETLSKEKPLGYQVDEAFSLSPTAAEGGRRDNLRAN
ncbi:MAG: hypothetical protein P8J27_03060 [Mariniblastus sp.]|nr:hypothetical protein [Mariniblastus sp.]